MDRATIPAAEGLATKTCFCALDGNPAKEIRNPRRAHCLYDYFAVGGTVSG